MSVVTARYAPGTPAWADIMVPDPRAAQKFYGTVLGWQYDTVAGNPSLYHLALARGRSAAGIMAPYGRKTPPIAWMTYLATDDLDATLRAVERAGGCQAAPVFDLGEVARGAIVIDPTDAEVGLWEGGSHFGAFVVDEPGAVCWSELFTRDLDAASDFYQRAFGLQVCPATPDVPDTGPQVGPNHRLLRAGGTAVAGLSATEERPQPRHTSFWLTCFGVADADVAAARAVSAGGTAVTSPEPTRWGRMARLRDPWGAVFAVVAVAPTAVETVGGGRQAHT